MQTTKADVLYAGADFHGNNVFLSVCDAGGTEVFRRRVKTDLEAVNTALNPFWPNIQQMGVESTVNWYWFVDGLRAQRRNVTLGNPAQMKQYSGLKSTDDRSDARWLAELVRLGIFPESGDFKRFPNAGCYASYCRTVKSERTSNGKKKGENNQRNGNPYLAWAFIEAASFAPRFYPEIQSWYDRKKKKRNSIVAKKALASKLAKAVWHVMNGEKFKMEMLF